MNEIKEALVEATELKQYKQLYKILATGMVTGLNSWQSFQRLFNASSSRAFFTSAFRLEPENENDQHVFRPTASTLRRCSESFPQYRINLPSFLFVDLIFNSIQPTGYGTTQPTGFFQTNSQAGRKRRRDFQDHAVEFFLISYDFSQSFQISNIDVYITIAGIEVVYPWKRLRKREINLLLTNARCMYNADIDFLKFR